MIAKVLILLPTLNEVDHIFKLYKKILTLKKLRDLGNTIIVIEHDAETMHAADWIIDVGPGAGIHGGKIIAEGTPDLIKQTSKSVTGQYLSYKKQISFTINRRRGNGKSIMLKKAQGNNLKQVNLCIPLNKFICVTGVSGSGKSTLINQTLNVIVFKTIFDLTYNLSNIPINTYSIISNNFW